MALAVESSEFDLINKGKIFNNNDAYVNVRVFIPENEGWIRSGWNRATITTFNNKLLKGFEIRLKDGAVIKHPAPLPGKFEDLRISFEEGKLASADRDGYVHITTNDGKNVILKPCFDNTEKYKCDVFFNRLSLVNWIRTKSGGRPIVTEEEKSEASDLLEETTDRIRIEEEFKEPSLEEDYPN